MAVALLETLQFEDLCLSPISSGGLSSILCPNERIRTESFSACLTNYF